MNICAVEECDRPSRARGWCGMHYQRWKKHGDPEFREQIFTKSLEEALELRAHREGGCYVWSGSLSADGYAIYNGHERREHGTAYLHRVMWERANGPIPEGLEIDHTCHTRNCIYIAHMRLADRSLNNSNLAGLKSNNKTGVRGVHWINRDQRYAAIVKHRGKTHYVGKFTDLTEAAQAVEIARQEIWADAA